MKKKIVLRILICLLVVAVLVIGAYAGLLGARKARSMWARLLQEFQGVQAKTEKMVKELQTDMHFLQGRYSFDYTWTNWPNPPLIAHAFGGVDGLEYTNTREAFLHNYEQGYRVFEVDFNLLSDGQQVASHDEGRWRERAGVDDSMEYNHENFMAFPLLDKYETMDYRSVIELMAEYPDIYVVTDTKEKDEASVKYQFSQLVWYARQVDPSVLDRMVVQVYNEDMLNWVMDIHPFRSALFTLYMAAWTPESVVDFCQRTGVRFITMPYGGFKPEIGKLWNDHGITVAVHTLNDPQQAQQFIKDGATWIYTDFLNPADFAR